MQRKRPPPAQRQIWTILLILALLFVLAAGTSCTASPHLYGGRGLVVFLPASTTPSSILAPF